MRNLNIFLLLTFALILSSCSSKNQPAFYPNAHFQSVGKEQANKDREQCMDLSKEYVKEKGRYDEMAKNSALGGVAGSVGGAVSGAIYRGNVGRSTAAGAAVGAILGIIRDLSTNNNQPNASSKAFVEKCLTQKGYQLVGWDGR